MYKSFDSIEDSYTSIMNLLSKQKESYLKDSYIKIKSMDNLNICIKNPRKNLINCPERHLNYKMLLGELIYNLQGKDDIESIKYYNVNYEKLSDNKDTINAMLGARIFFYEGLFDIYKDENVNSDGEVLSQFTCEHIILNQFETCIEKLSNGYNSFNINIFNPLLDINTNHTSEISNLMFYITNDKINLNVNVLEIDFYTRYPYISFILSTLLAILADKLNKDVGKLIFNFNLLFTFNDRCDIINIYKNNLSLEDNKFYNEDIFTIIFDLELMSRIQGNLINVDDCRDKINSINNKYWMSLISCLIKLNTELNDFDDFIIEEHKVLI